jgi:CelD/BcsL family acetyltransferase involved in cellulose biosynthesis
VFDGAGTAAFIRDVACAMARQGAAEVLFLTVEGVRVAGVLTLLTPRTTYFSFSGLDPEYWAYSAVTLLQWEAARRAVEAGRDRINLSVGPDVAKLRWSEEVHAHPEFVVVRRRRRSQSLFGVYWLASAAARVVRDRSRQVRAAGEG